MSQTLQFESEEPPAGRIERLFLDWSEPFLPAAARVLAERYASEDALRMDGAVVVVPGARAGRRLKELLLAEAERGGRRLIPPRVVTVGGLPELLYDRAMPLASGAATRRAWVRALRALPAGRLAELFPTAPPPADLVGWSRLAATVEALHVEVCGAGLRFGDVPPRCGEAGLFYDDGARWMILSEVQEAYAGTLRDAGYLDPWLARIAAVDELGGFAMAIWLAGVAEIPPIVRRMLERLPGAQLRALVHAPAGEAACFDELGCVLPAAWAARDVPLADEALEVCGRPAEQAEAVVRTLEGLDGRYAAEEIVVAAADEELVPHLAQKLSAAGVPVRAAAGSRISRTPVVRLLVAVADYVDGRSYEAVAALARHPDLWQWLRRADGSVFREPGDWIAPLDAYFAEHLPARLGAGRVPGSDRAAAAVGAFCRALDAPRLLGRVRGRRRIGQWMPEILALLVEVYGETELRRAVPEHRELGEAAAALKSAAADLHRLPPLLDEECDAATAIRLLVEAVGVATIPPEADETAVEILGWLEIHLDDAPVAVVTGFNEDFLPESVNADAFLPDSLRRRLGLIDNAARYARDAYQLTAVLRSRPHVKLIAGRRSGAGDPLRPSRLMFAVDDAALPERVQRFYGRSGAAVGAAGPVPVEAAPGARAAASAFVLPPEPEIRAAEPIDSISVTAFKQILENPYLFALRHVRRLDEIDDAARELDAPGFGDLAHRVLQRFGSSGAAGATDPREVSAALDAELDGLADERFGRDPLPAVRLQVEQLRVRLNAFARWHADWIAQGWRVAEVEAAVDGAPFLAGGAAIRLRGRIDRIDHHPELGWAVFDYKTGDRGDTPEATHRKGRPGAKEWKDLQLPMYRHLLPHVRRADGGPLPGLDAGDRVRLGYIVLPRESEQVRECFAEWSEAELSEADECARSVVEFLREGVFRHDPDAKLPWAGPALASLMGEGYLQAAESAERAAAGEASDD